MISAKNYAVEFWRFLFTLLVVMGHLEISTVLAGETFGRGGMSVEFFFILSGFLLFQGYQKAWNKENSILGFTINLIRKRVVRFAPIYYICFLMGALYHIYLYSMYTDKTAMDILSFEKGLWPELVFLNSIVFHADSANSSTWFISALLICTLLLVLMLSSADKAGVKPWIILTAVFIVCFYFHFFTGIEASLSRITRALYGLSLGGICYLFTYKLHEEEMYVPKKGLMTLFEIICISGIIYCLFLYKGNSEIRIPLLLFCSGLIISSFLQKSIVSKFLNRKIFAFLGSISYAIYVSHLQVLTKFGWLPGFNLLENKVYSYVVILTTVIGWGVFINYLPLIIKKAFKWLYGLVHAEDTLKYIRYGK